MIPVVVVLSVGRALSLLMIMTDELRYHQIAFMKVAFKPERYY